jgi:hypothetical protein
MKIVITAPGINPPIVDAVGDPGRVHQIAGEDEERHRQQRKTVEAARHAVQDDEVGNVRDEVRIQQRGKRQCDEHGNAGQQGREENENQDRHGWPGSQSA